MKAHSQNQKKVIKLESLIKKAKKGDKQAFIQLIEEQRGSMVQVASAILKNHEDIEDAIQECIITVYKKLGTLKENRYFKTWLIRILIHNCYDIIKSRNNFVDIKPYLEEQYADEYETTDDIERRYDVNAALSELHLNDRLVLTLFYIEDLSVRQISKIMELSENAVKLRISRSRKKFKTIYMNKEEAICQ